jgi:UDP-N-acetylmuramate--alanine ligase
MTKSYHFIGIGGIGMGGLASLVLARGHRVSGSDLRENSLTQKLALAGARIFIGHDAANISCPDFVVVSSAIREDNPEYSAARERSVPVLRRAELLASLTEGFRLISVAGAHGKTTTTSLAAHVLQGAGLGPTVAVGGIVNSLGSNSQWGQGKYFVLEADESDGTFLNFFPEYSIITNVDREHLDFYKDFSHVLAVYRRFMEQTSPEGVLIVCGEDPHLLGLTREIGRKVLTYGRDGQNDISPFDIHNDGFETRFSCRWQGLVLGPFHLPVPGPHNILNAMAVILLAQQLGIDPGVLRRSLADYQGVRRRFQQVGLEEGILIVDDYAHHPTEIKAVLGAAEAFAGRRRVAVFQPHRYSRLSSLYAEFLDCWGGVDELIVTDIYAAGEKPVEGLRAPRFVQDLRDRKGISARYLPGEELAVFLKSFCRFGDLVLTMGAGDVTEVGYQLRELLRSAAVVKS